MAGLRPGREFVSVDLDTSTVRVGQRFGRIYFGEHANPLGFGKSRSRFSDPRRRINKNLFGVVYVGESLKVCFLEAVLRDKRNGVVEDYPISERELYIRKYAEIEIAEELTLVNLLGDGAIRMGIPRCGWCFATDTLSTLVCRIP
jgi:hypothetical protein